MENARQQLLRLLATLSFKLGHFKLTSGGTSDYYVDCRLTTLHAEGARNTARAILDEIERHGWRPDAIGGMTLGADPIVTAVAMLSAQLQQARAAGSLQLPSPGLIHGFLVRKAEKAHGMGQRIEGYRKQGARAVIVDDVCTTGASTISAIQAAREAGFEVVGVLCLVERQEAHGRNAVEKAASPAPFVSLFTDNDVRQEHLQQLAAEAKVTS
ncbi:MAG: orotate phosphoribosyltransferase [Candidatus Korobacteraceae bacterium]|jgi:orotate phosphoribosyltransferase